MNELTNDTHGVKMPEVVEIIKEESLLDDLINTAITSKKKCEKLVEMSSGETLSLCGELVIDKEYLKVVINYYKTENKYLNEVIQKKAGNA